MSADAMSTPEVPQRESLPQALYDIIIALEERREQDEASVTLPSGVVVTGGVVPQTLDVSKPTVVTDEDEIPALAEVLTNTGSCLALTCITEEGPFEIVESTRTSILRKDAGRASQYLRTRMTHFTITAPVKGEECSELFNEEDVFFGLKQIMEHVGRGHQHHTACLVTGGKIVGGVIKQPSDDINVVGDDTDLNYAVQQLLQDGVVDIKVCPPDKKDPIYIRLALQAT